MNILQYFDICYILIFFFFYKLYTYIYIYIWSNPSVSLDLSRWHEIWLKIRQEPSPRSPACKSSCLPAQSGCGEIGGRIRKLGEKNKNKNKKKQKESIKLLIDKERKKNRTKEGTIIPPHPPQRYSLPDQHHRLAHYLTFFLIFFSLIFLFPHIYITEKPFLFCRKIRSLVFV